VFHLIPLAVKSCVHSSMVIKFHVMICVVCLVIVTVLIVSMLISVFMNCISSGRDVDISYTCLNIIMFIMYVKCI
jgi:hypothetical protein